MKMMQPKISVPPVNYIDYNLLYLFVWMFLEYNLIIGLLFYVILISDNRYKHNMSGTR
jgi:hypothetical protein